MLPGRGEGPDNFAQPIFIFDGECGFCRNSVMRLQRTLPHGWQPAASQAINYQAFELSDSDVSASSWWIENDGETLRLYSGAQSFGALLLNSRRWFGWLGLFTFVFPFSFVSNLIYRAIARNRGRFSVGTSTCD